MNDSKLMQVLNSTNDLLEEPTSFRFLQLLLLHNVIKQLTSADVLHYQEELLWCFNNFEKLDNVWVTNHLQNINFPCNSQDISILNNLPFL